MCGRERELVHLIQYLNLEEMRTFCKTHRLPLLVHVETPAGDLRKTGDRDRKDVVLARILEFAIDGKKSGPTIYSKNVVSNAPLPSRLTDRSRLYYGQYDKKNANFIRKMKELTGGEFRNGMIARLVLRDFWAAGTAPTLRELADVWTRATRGHTEPRPEGAYLADLSKGRAMENWKQLRIENATKALAMLDRMIARLPS